MTVDRDNARNGITIADPPRGRVTYSQTSGWVQPGAALGPAREPTTADGDNLARHIRNEQGRTFWSTGGERISGDQAFAQVMARAQARMHA